MKKLISFYLFAAVVLVSFTVLAQEAPSVGETAVMEEAAPAEEAVQVEGSAVAEPASAREILEKGLTVEPGATANVNLNENVINVPDEMTIKGKVDANIKGKVDAKVTGSIDVAGRLKVERADMSWCEGNPIGCTFLIVGIVGAVAGGGFYIADQLGAFDTTNTVSYR